MKIIQSSFTIVHLEIASQTAGFIVISMSNVIALFLWMGDELLKYDFYVKNRKF